MALKSLLKSQIFQLCLAFGLGALVLVLPRPEGTRFRVIGDPDQTLFQRVATDFRVVPTLEQGTDAYVLEILNPTTHVRRAAFLQQQAKDLDLRKASVEYVNGLSPKAKRFLAVLAVLVFLFVVEVIPLEITAILIGVFLVVMRITTVKDAWAPYMHPVVVFIMCCLVFAIALDKAGITKRMGYFIARKAGDSVTRFTFIVAIGLGIASTVMHDAAATAVGIVTMLPLMRAAGVQPYSRTARFMMLSVPFACSCGGMGTLVGGGRCMVSATFLKEFTGIEITFLDWIKFALPAALVTVPAAVMVVYLLNRPDPNIRLPQFKEDLGPFTAMERRTLIIVLLVFIMWLTKGFHGIDYSVTGMLGVAAMVLFRVINWEDIHSSLEWGTALFIFGGGISLGLGMASSGAADYLANLFFPFVKGGGWLLLFVGVGVFGALVTNVMANVAAAALILPIVLPMAQLEGVDPRVLALCLGMATSFAMILVIGCPPNALAYSYRHFKSSDLTKVGLLATPILLALLVLVASLWWKIMGLV